MPATALNWVGEKLSRVTSSGEYIPELDGLRFIALLTVVAHHVMASYLTSTQRLGKIQLPQDWYTVSQQNRMVKVLSHGNFGVALFFVISGFILAIPFARKYLHGNAGPTLRAYYLRRLTRLEPPYTINIVLCFLIIMVTAGSENPRDYIVAFGPHLIASLIYLHGLIYAGTSWVNGVTWSLEVEVQFYLIVPLLCLLFRVRSQLVRRSILTALILAFGVLSQVYIEPSTHLRLRLCLINFLQYFLAGLLLADLYLLRRQATPRRTNVVDCVTLLSAVMVVMVLVRYPSYYFLLPFLVAAFYVGVFLGKLSNRVLRIRPLAILGGMCYTVYLYHALIITYLQPATARLASARVPLSLDFAGQLLLLGAPIVLICSILFVWIEKPFMRTPLTYRKRQHSMD